MVFTIVMPTFMRRDLLLHNVAALAHVEHPWPIELVIVIDGSTDGSYEAVVGLQLPFPCRVLRQANAGAAAARNAGAEIARGAFLLFLDDDMEADGGLLLEHHRKLAGGGADVVVGHMPLADGSPATVVTDGVRRWADDRLRRLSRSDRVELVDLLTGQLSIRTDLFRRLGGFDPEYTRGGRFGGEDTDLLFRLRSSGANIVGAPLAVSHQHYVTTARQHLAQRRDGGRADVLLLAKHPTLRPAGLTVRHAGRWSRPLVAAPERLGVPVDAVAEWVARRADQGRRDAITRVGFTIARDWAYWSGAAAARSRPPGRQAVRVLAYHMIERDRGDAVSPFGVAPDRFEEQIDSIIADGWTVLSPAEFLSQGRSAVRPKSVLLTFDDGYRSVYENAYPLLRALRLPALLFAVTGQLGGCNAWDVRRGANERPLVSRRELLRLAESGWSIGAHTRTHPRLTPLTTVDQRAEILGPIEDLRAAGLPAPSAIAYPYGQHSAAVRRIVDRAGYAAGFGIDRACVGRKRLAHPRIEVRADTTAADLLELLRRGPAADLRGQARMELRSLLRRAPSVPGARLRPSPPADGR